MTRNHMLLLGCSLVLIGCFNPAPPATPPAPQSGSAQVADRVWFTGSSNIRNFSCNAKQVYVSAEAAPEDFDRTKEDGIPAVKRAALLVPVRSLDCGIGLQNTHLFEALAATEYPTISFALSGYSVEPSETVHRVRMNGALRIAGVERQVVVRGSAVRDASGQWILRGDREISVRDFGVAPPRRFFGLLRVRDEVTVHFEVAVRPLIDPLGVLVTSLQ